MTDKLTHYQMLELLERIQPEETKKERLDELSQLNLADSLLMLAELDHEREYNICRSVALHLLGMIPEPDDAEISES